MEEWIEIEGYPSYEISNKGKIRNKRSGTVLQYTTHPRTKLEMVNLWSPKGRRSYNVHRLVATHFIGPENPGFSVNFINGDRKDLCVENLEWQTTSKVRDINADRRLTSPTDNREVVAIDLGELYPNALAAARELGGLEKYILAAARSYGAYAYLRTRWAFKMALDVNPPIR